MSLLWFLNPSLGADYGTFTCQECGRIFHYSPRLECHCHTCAIKELEHKELVEKDKIKRYEYSYALKLLRGE